MVLNLALVFLCCLLLTAGQMLCKLGVNEVRLLESAGPFSIVLQALARPYTIVGLFTYGIATLLWFHLLSRFDFSYVYPLISLTFVLALFGSRLILGESIPPNRWIGVVIIVLGVIISGRK